MGRSTERESAKKKKTVKVNKQWMILSPKIIAHQKNIHFHYAKNCLQNKRVCFPFVLYFLPVYAVIWLYYWVFKVDVPNTDSINARQVLHSKNNCFYLLMNKLFDKMFVLFQRPSIRNGLLSTASGLTFSTWKMNFIRVLKSFWKYLQTDIFQ